MKLDKIVSARIHPAIGVARVGDSPTGYFIGPELPWPTPSPDGGYKDALGRLKRQAARFRVYGYDAAGEPVAELTSENAGIEWTVHVANTKSAWYDFDVALDIGQAAGTRSPRRNASIRGADRAKLRIDPGPRTIAGKNARAEPFDTGRFFDTNVYLGELHTDEAGRLIFLGGRGVSDTVFSDKKPSTFANNAGWHDDVSDGPVHATVRLGNRTIVADPAWVVTAPPNYAPHIVSPQTMYDVIYDTIYKRWLKDPADTTTPKPSFRDDILPLLQQLTDTQWVNYAFLQHFGWRGAYDFRDEELLRKLSTPPTAPGNDPYGELRLQIFYQFRDPGATELQQLGWPPIYGDAFGNFLGPAAGFSVTKTTYTQLTNWMNGRFTADYRGPVSRVEQFDKIPLRERPHTLDRAALHWCMGGPFHPGCEMTWTMRQVVMYRAPFRLRERPAALAGAEYGEYIDAALATAEDGPLSSSGPGDVTKWMAVPWQTDTASCRSGYPYPPFQSDSYIPTFWPSRVPNDVLTPAQAAIVMDERRPISERRDAFNLRKRFLRGLNWDAPYVEQIATMVQHFGKLGVVEPRKNTAKDGAFPAVFQVEIGAAVPADERVFVRAHEQPHSLRVSEDFALARFGGPPRRS